MSIQPLVSVVIPAFNAEAFLNKCLTSVCRQSYTNLEIILINDGSTDNTEKICNEWKTDDRRIIYTAQENCGQGLARNRGISLAKGEYLTFIDADDWVASDYIEKLYNQMLTENADICKTVLSMIDEKTGKQVGQVSAAPIEKENPLSYDAPHVAGILYKKELFDKYKIKMPKIKYEDLSVYPLLALLANKITIVEEELYFYRVNTGTSTMDNISFLTQYPSALAFLLDESVRLKIYEKHKRLFFDICVMHLNSSLDRIKEGNYQAELSQLFTSFLSNRFSWWKKFYNPGSWIYDGSLFTNISREDFQPKVSILIPIYNVENFLETCLQSVVSQTLQDIEIICINDGSTDNSEAILKDFQKLDPRIKVINKENSGYGHSMNTGLALAKGEYIGIVESDDFADPGMFETLYDKACIDMVDVIKSNYYSHGYNSGIDEFVEPLWGCEYNKLFKPEEDQRIFFASQTIWSAIYRREFLINNGISFNETPGASFQDTAFTFKVWMMAEKALLIRDAFLHYRIDNLNSSVQSSKKIFCICDEYQEIERYLSQYPKKKAALYPTMLAVKYRSYRWNYERVDAAYQYAFLLKFVQEFTSLGIENFLKEKAWKSEDWREFHTLLQNMDEFYQKTTRAVFEDKVRLLNSRNARLSEDAINKIVPLYSKIYIFGDGGIGSLLYTKLKSIVENGDILIFQGDKIYEMQFTDNLDKEESIIIIAVEREWQPGLQQKSEELGFKNIILCGEEWKDG